MKILVLDRSPYGNAADPRSDALLADAARRLGHEAEVREAVGLGAESASAQVVLARADLRSPEDLESFAATLRRLEGQGVRCFPSADGLVAAEDKRRTQEFLAGVGLPVVPTLVVGISAEGEVLPGESFPGSAVVLKEPVGWGGRGFTVCRDAADLRRAAASVSPHSRGGTLLLQTFVRHRRGITVQVAGRRAVGAFATPGRADSSPVPEVYEDVVVDEVTAADAVHAVAACGLVFGSVDFADAEDGTRPILEVNAMPGLDPDDAGDRAFAEAIVRAVTGTA